MSEHQVVELKRRIEEVEDLNVTFKGQLHQQKLLE